MSSAPPGKRVWNCPDCGGEVLLSMTQLDPLACPACVTKLKGGGSTTSSGLGATGAAGGPLQIVTALPESVRLAGVGIVALLLGLLIGFVAGRVNTKQANPTGPSRVAQYQWASPVGASFKLGFVLDRRVEMPTDPKAFFHSRSPPFARRSEEHTSELQSQ